MKLLERVVDAALHSATPVNVYMDMPVLRFYDFWEAIAAVQERRAEEMRRTR